MKQSWTRRKKQSGDDWSVRVGGQYPQNLPEVVDVRARRSLALSRHRFNNLLDFLGLLGGGVIVVH